jgi:hypothetical protein
MPRASNQGHITEAHQIERQWDELQRTAASVRSEPQESAAFPTAVLEGVVEEVIDYFPSAGIKPSNPAIMPIANLLNDSWQEFLKKTAAFRVWKARSDWQPEISITTGGVELSSAATQRSTDGSPQPAGRWDDRADIVQLFSRLAQADYWLNPDQQSFF